MPAVAARERWRLIMKVRDELSRSIENVRRDGQAGSSLAVEVDLWLDGDLLEAVASMDNELRFVLLTSEARAGQLSEAPADAERHRLEGGDLALIVTPSEHDKCVRCWHYRADVGSDPEHPEICGRCVENIFGAGEMRQIA